MRARDAAVRRLALSAVEAVKVINNFFQFEKTFTDFLFFLGSFPTALDFPQPFYDVIILIVVVGIVDIRAQGRTNGVLQYTKIISFLIINNFY